MRKRKRTIAIGVESRVLFILHNNGFLASGVHRVGIFILVIIPFIIIVEIARSISKLYSMLELALVLIIEKVME